MYLEGKAVMKQITKKYKEWLWFIALWLAGFGALTITSYLIKLIMKI